MISNEVGQVGAEFGPGPWAGEPGRAEWYSYGLPCLIRRNRMGVWCGYVAVPPGHPFHGEDYDLLSVEVHGRLGYADFCDGEEGVGICHVPRPGEPGDVYWFGFDCGHYCDVLPSGLGDQDHGESEGSYRDVAYVTAETEKLAAQLAAVTSQAER